MSRKEKIDAILSKWVSRKLMVFTIATVALFTKALESWDFTIIAVIYIGSQTAIDIASVLKK
jgi:hypothetical protein